MSDPLFFGLVAAGLVLLLAGGLLTWRRNALRSGGGSGVRPSGRRTGPRPAVEREAAAISEAIEDLVNQKLAQIPGLETTRLDFGTSADGSLEIWIGDERYGSVEEIADRRIRETVAEAVAQFNR